MRKNNIIEPSCYASVNIYFLNIKFTIAVHLGKLVISIMRGLNDVESVLYYNA